MKTKKIVIGAMAAAMLSLSVCSLMPASAADGTVQITVGKATAEAGGAFSVDVSLADIPATGASLCQFSIEYDKSVLTVSDVKLGTAGDTGAANADASSASLPVFEVFTDTPGVVSVTWSTSLDDASYWLKSDGVFCTLSGTVAAGVEKGTVSAIKVVPTNRETHDGSGVANDLIDIGYVDGSGVPVRYNTNVTDGSVTVGTPTKGMKGDANCDNTVDIADSVKILQYLANAEKYPLTNEGLENADCDGSVGITGSDALQIQKYDAKIITEL